MRKEIACVILILLAACVNKPGLSVQEATSTAVIGGADSMTSIVVADTCASFQDTVTYELRQCQLWYTKDLPKHITEKPVCGQNMKYIQKMCPGLMYL